MVFGRGEGGRRLERDGWMDEDKIDGGRMDGWMGEGGGK